jgi:hypothetical protein
MDACANAPGKNLAEILAADQRARACAPSRNTTAQKTRPQRSQLTSRSHFHHASACPGNPGLKTLNQASPQTATASQTRCRAQYGQPLSANPAELTR